MQTHPYGAAPAELEAFEAFARALSFTAAAKRLHRSQPAVFGQVKRLGESLGVALYRRENGTIILTEAGERVLRYAREQRTRTEELMASISGSEREHPVTLAAGEGVYLYLLGSRLGELARSNALRLETRDAAGTLAAVRNGAAHLGAGSFDAPEDLECSTLAIVPMCLAIREDHPLARRRQVQLDDLDGQHWVLPGPGRPHRSTITGTFESRGLSYTIAVEANGWPLMLRFVELGVGVAIVNGYCRPPLGVMTIPITDFHARTFRLIWAPGASPSVISVRQALLDSTQSSRPQERPRPRRSR